MLFRKPACEYLIAGLGNPGEKYAETRHNVGFRTVDLVAENAGVRITRAKFQALTARAELGGVPVLLMKPQTYMNESGLALGQAAAFYKLPPERIIILYDDIDLPVGRVRVRAAGSAGGHNGMKSIIQHLGSQDFPRVRIGVGAKPHPDYDLADWVLSRFSALEKKSLDPAIEHAAAAAELIVREGGEAAACHYNGL